MTIEVKTTTCGQAVVQRHGSNDIELLYYGQMDNAEKPRVYKAVLIKNMCVRTSSSADGSVRVCSDKLRGVLVGYRINQAQELPNHYPAFL